MCYLSPKAVFFYFYFRSFISRFFVCFYFFRHLYYTILKQLTISNITIDTVKRLWFTRCVGTTSLFSRLSAAFIGARHMHVDHKTFTLLPSVEICGFHLIYYPHMVAGLESQARLNLFTLNYAKKLLFSITSLNIMIMMMRRRRRRSSGLTIPLRKHAYIILTPFNPTFI